MVDTSGIDRLSLMEILISIPQEQLLQIIFSLNPPSGIIPSNTSQGQQAFALLQWAQSPYGCGLEKVQAVLDTLIKPPVNHSKPEQNQVHPQPTRLGDLIMKLSGADFQKLVNSMLQSYPNISDLSMMVRFYLEEDLNAISGGQTTREIIFNLITWAEAHGNLVKLLKAISKDRPNNGFLQKNVKEILISVISVDYTKLENYLKNREWKQADEETYRVILQLARKKQNELLNSEDIENLSCEELRTINDLWVTYSNGKFGFTVQKQIWLDCGGKIGVEDYENYKNYAEKVGWYNRAKDIWYADIEYQLHDGTKIGHLPFFRINRLTSHQRAIMGIYSSYIMRTPPKFGINLFSRIEACGM